MTGARLSPLDLYEAALEGADVVAASRFGVHRLDVATWLGDPDLVDRLVLDRCEPPVLDLGCGPGRLVATLCARGVPALGVDISARAVAQARARGATAMQRALERRLPAEGAWGTVLLVDGNIGIGGDPVRLLARCRRLVRDDGLVLVEADPDPDADDALRLELACADGRRSRPLRWARAGARTIAALAAAVGLVPAVTLELSGRTIVALRAFSAPRAS